MGVGGLQAFMEKHCPQSIRTVYLEQMVKTYRAKNPNIAEPILVIDGHNCMFELYRGLDWLCSGQWLEFIDVIQKFVQSLKNLGIKPVFFFDGSTPISKRDVWYKRRINHLEQTVQIYSLLKAKCAIPESMFQLPASIRTLIRFALKYVCNVPVYLVINGDCDQIIATFAARNNCLGILTQDSDYVIYNTAPFISVKNFNFNALKSVIYDRDMFCAVQNINIWQLPLLACLMGNDYVPRETLNEFHREIVSIYADKTRAQQYSSYNIRILASVIQFIKNLHLHDYGTDFEPHFLQLSVRLENLRNGLAMYKLNDNRCKLYRNPHEAQPHAIHDTSDPAGIFEYVLEKSINVEMSELFFNALMIGSCEIGPALEEEGNLSFSPSVLIYRPIRQRLYDLILSFRVKYIDARVASTRIGMPPSSKDYIEELWVHSMKPKSDQVTRSPVRVNGDIPDLLTMWTDTSPATDQLKWETVHACLNLSQSIECLKGTANKFKLLCMILNYLIQSPNVPLESWEVDAFLIQCVLPKSFDVDFINTLKVKPYDYHAVHLAAVFNRGIIQFHNVLSICGQPLSLKQSMPWHYFDGKRFHHCYTALKSGTTVESLCSNGSAFDQYKLLKDATYENLPHIN